MKIAILAALLALVLAIFALRGRDAPVAPPPTLRVAPAPSGPAPPSPAAVAGDAAAFVPLQSDQVKDAIHRALRTGETQRWAEGRLSGYAVPSPARGANGCRAVRYTIDQRRDVPFESITACE